MQGTGGWYQNKKWAGGGGVTTSAPKKIPLPPAKFMYKKPTPPANEMGTKAGTKGG